MLGGSGLQARCSSERAPRWADDILDHQWGGPTSTEDSDYGLPEAGRRLMPAVTSRTTLASMGNLLTSPNAVWVAVQWPLNYDGGFCACATSDNGPSQCLDRRAAATSSCRWSSRERSIGQPHTAPPGSQCSSRWLRPTAPARVQNWLIPHQNQSCRAAAASPRWQPPYVRGVNWPFSSLPGSPHGSCRPTLAAPVRAKRHQSTHHRLGHRTAAADSSQRLSYESDTRRRPSSSLPGSPCGSRGLRPTTSA